MTPDARIMPGRLYICRCVSVELVMVVCVTVNNHRTRVVTSRSTVRRWWSRRTTNNNNDNDVATNSSTNHAASAANRRLTPADSYNCTSSVHAEYNPNYSSIDGPLRHVELLELGQMGLALAATQHGLTEIAEHRLTVTRYE